MTPTKTTIPTTTNVTLQVTYQAQTKHGWYVSVPPVEVTRTVTIEAGRYLPADRKVTIEVPWKNLAKGWDDEVAELVWNIYGDTKQAWYEANPLRDGECVLEHMRRWINHEKALKALWKGKVEAEDIATFEAEIAEHNDRMPGVALNGVEIMVIKRPDGRWVRD